ncbi:tRNA lysidine(34) synthetase TilS [Flagellimonas myxillae]|uniref:tRNA lysidine(34) synthetase TilS n=1 Tax=Flagellimonas myxillae TaxID=2942214 RepID=UPI00201F23D3|nr:tRNA lysidine(34) synthetase TilS [Muricauda myxillae]MCL6265768.1 tRNA lysidine(34) synthetase TilS [Muricauda myxillae]
MLSEFEAHIKNHFPFLQGRPILIACSGGLDSVVLTHLAHKLGWDITLAHCNFNLRGKESDGDEAFVRDLAKQLGVGVEVKSFETSSYVETHRGSVQMGARRLRYDWFKSLLETGSYDYVLTAHHADDSLETFLINLSRGTGVDGLSGIPAQNGKIVRPLLPFSRRELQDFAATQNVEWREDSSNQETKYLRNKIRHQLAPELKGLHPSFLENFKSTQEHLRNSKNLLGIYTDQLKARLFEETDGLIRVNTNQLLQLKPLEPHLYELFKEFGFREWDDVKGLLTAPSGKEVHSTTHRMLKDREDLILAEKHEKSNQNFLVSAKETAIKTPIRLQFEEVKIMGQTSKQTIFVDKEKLNYPLLLRNWEKGDYFYPFGMQGKKKLSKFFKDEKMDVFSKEKQWLLCSGDAVVWVVGQRMDDRFKVEPSTQTILKITLLL